MTAIALACLLALHQPPPDPCAAALASKRAEITRLLDMREDGLDYSDPVKRLLDQAFRELKATQRRCGETPRRYTDDGDQKNPPQVGP